MTKFIEAQEAVYIPSLEASSIYSYNKRNQPLFIKYVGMIPSSLELEALIDNGLNIKTNKRGKRMSNDVINVQFKTKVRDSSEIYKNLCNKIADAKKQLEKINNKINDENIKKKDRDRLQVKATKKEEYIDKLETNRDFVKTQNEPEFGVEELRTFLYENGFTLDYVDYKTGEIETISYVVYKRSTAKSRTGKVLFIREELYHKMIEWSRMGINFNDNTETDYVSLLAYESLVGSSIIGMLNLNPNNVLVIDDVKSTFWQMVNKVSKVDGVLKSKLVEDGITQTLWDGQSLMDESVFTDLETDKSMLLLRQHMFKSACFRANVQQYLMDHAEAIGVKYDNYSINDYFGNSVKAKDIMLITTPSSLKFLKFAEKLGNKEAIWEHWKQTVADQGSMFGVVKYEKGTKLGCVEGKPVQQMSYQFINSLDCTNEQLKELAQFELDYIDKLKNDIDSFVQYTLATANMCNSNEMMASLYKHNKDFAGTEMFRDWKATEINEYVSRVMMGKLKILNADYAVLLGNPMEMLAATVGTYKEEQAVLKSNQVHTKMFELGDEICGFRSPHTSPSNILWAVNTENQSINKYLPNLSKNIIVVNSIHFPICEILSGSDYDSDSLLITSNKVLTSIAKECSQSYHVCVHDIGQESKKYVVSNSNCTSVNKVDT